MAIPKFYFENTTVASLESKNIIINVKESIDDGWHPIIMYNFDLTVKAEDAQIEK